MARLKVLPHQAVIDGLKGKLDFYVMRGVPCVRRWPRSPGHRRSPAVEAGWPPFTYISSKWADLPQEIQDAYNEMASGTALSGRDFFTRGYFGSIYRYEFP